LVSGHLFPYREEGNPPTLRPSLDVRLTHGPHGDWTCRALVDTGAPITLFDRGVADALGIRIRPAGAEHGWVTVLGGNWQIQYEDVDLAVPNNDGLAWTARVAFVLDQRLQMPFQGVLGSRGFLDQFAVTFNQYYDYFIVGRPDDSDDLHRPESR
jgi:hypothetical protein